MASGESAPRGSFGLRVAATEQTVNELDLRLDSIEGKLDAIEQRFDRLEALVDPDELDWIWANFEDLTECLSAVRRKVGFSPLSEFRGTRERRRKAEAAR